MLSVSLERPADLAATGRLWRDLERRADPSPFQTWTWVGCRAAQRYPDPVLLHAREEGQTVALALCNRRAAPLAAGALWVGESGEARADAVFVERNGPLIARGHEPVLPACLHALLSAPIAGVARARPRAAVLSGVPDAVLHAARSLPAACVVHRTREARLVEFAALAPGAFPNSLGSSARYQLRRSLRQYATRGEAEVRRAATAQEALGFLDALAAWHQRTWTARGQPGAFGDPRMLAFHRALVAEGCPRGEVDLLRIGFGGRPVGYLYNLRAGGIACNYQGGFDYAGAAPHEKPGLTCHHLAIEMYRAQGARCYDFLAGEARYKSSLANRGEALHWLEIMPRASARHAWLRARAWAGRVRHAATRPARKNVVAENPFTPGSNAAFT